VITSATFFFAAVLRGFEMGVVFVALSANLYVLRGVSRQHAGHPL